MNDITIIPSALCSQPGCRHEPAETVLACPALHEVGAPQPTAPELHELRVCRLCRAIYLPFTITLREVRVILVVDRRLRDEARFAAVGVDYAVFGHAPDAQEACEAFAKTLVTEAAKAIDEGRYPFQWEAAPASYSGLFADESATSERAFTATFPIVSRLRLVVESVRMRTVEAQTWFERTSGTDGRRSGRGPERRMIGSVPSKNALERSAERAERLVAVETQARALERDLAYARRELAEARGDLERLRVLLAQGGSSV